jgi:hypothetical protein
MVDVFYIGGNYINSDELTQSVERYIRKEQFINASYDIHGLFWMSNENPKARIILFNLNYRVANSCVDTAYSRRGTSRIDFSNKQWAPQHLLKIA